MIDNWLFPRHLEDDEHIMVIVHRHWLMGVRQLFLPTISFILAFWLIAFAQARFLYLIAGLWALVSIVWWIRHFLDYYLDAWIITDMGIISLEWKGWFHRHSARVLYSDLQGVSYEIHGLLATMLRYGTVTIEKISTGGSFSLSHVPRPRRVETEILQNMEAYLQTKNLKDSKRVQEILSEYVTTKVQQDDL